MAFLKKDNNKKISKSKIQDSKEEHIHTMFSAIANRYDLLNTVLSFSKDKSWRCFAVDCTGIKAGGYGLDVCCGTGKLALEMARRVGTYGKIVGIDFCENMLLKAQENIRLANVNGVVELMQGNAMNLPFPDNKFDCATIGFALRNVLDLRRVLSEMLRVVKPGGKVVSLELAHPGIPVFKQFYFFYFNWVVPLLGKLGSKVDGPYSYLPASLKNFPHQSKLRDIFVKVGMVDACYYELSGGIVAVHVGTKFSD